MSKKAKKLRKEARQDDEFKEKLLNNDEPIIEDDFDEDINIRMCSIKGCQNIAMQYSNVCIKHYEEISNEMAKTVKKNDFAPWKLI